MKIGTRTGINIKAGIISCVMHLNFGGSQSVFPQYAPNSKLEEYWRIDRHKLAAVSLLMGEPQGGSAVVLRLTAILPLAFYRVEYGGS